MFTKSWASKEVNDRNSPQTFAGETPLLFLIQSPIIEIIELSS